MKNVVFAALVLVLMACAPANSETTATSQTAAKTATTTTSATTSSSMSDMRVPPPKTAKPAKEKKSMPHENKVAELHTSAGEIDIRFFPDVAPKHVKNFIDLAQKGFYNGTKFHRVIPGFMIQGGDPNTIAGSKDTWGTGGSDQFVPAEFSTVKHKRGVVSMARTPDPNSARSQFFIMVADYPSLDGQYSAFGVVIKGMDVADKIVSAPTEGQNRPIKPTTIDKIVIRDAKPGETGPTPK